MPKPFDCCRSWFLKLLVNFFCFSFCLCLCPGGFTFAFHVTPFPSLVILRSTVCFFDPTDDPIVVNNMSVCALYNNNISIAVNALEEVIRMDPIRCPLYHTNPQHDHPEAYIRTQTRNANYYYFYRRYSRGTSAVVLANLRTLYELSSVNAKVNIGASERMSERCVMQRTSTFTGKENFARGNQHVVCHRRSFVKCVNIFFALTSSADCLFFPFMDWRVLHGSVCHFHSRWSP